MGVDIALEEIRETTPPGFAFFHDFRQTSQPISNITMRIVSEYPIFADFSRLFSICLIFVSRLTKKWSPKTLKCAIIEVEEEVILATSLVRDMYQSLHRTDVVWPSHSKEMYEHPLLMNTWIGDELLSTALAHEHTSYEGFLLKPFPSQTSQEQLHEYIADMGVATRKSVTCTDVRCRSRL